MVVESRQDQLAATPSGVPIWYDAKVRAIFYQIVAVLLFLAVIGYLTNNTITNLEKRGIATGFAFLRHPTGFGIAGTAGTNLVGYSESSTYASAFLVGILNTLFVSVVGIVLATMVGFLLGVARLSSNWLIAKLATVYIEVIRNVPLLLQILFWYFGVLTTLPRLKQSLEFKGAFFLNNRGLYSPRPIFESGAVAIAIAFAIGVVGAIVLARWAKRRQELTGQRFPVFLSVLVLIIGLPVLATLATGVPFTWEYPVLRGFNFQGGLVVIPEFMALLLALVAYTGAFIGEIVRAGIQSVSRGQTEAAHSLGVRPGPTLRLVIIPQALRVIIPPLTSQFLNLTKNSSLAAAIGYPELVAVFSGTVLNQTGQAVECIALTMLVYFTISLCISLYMNWYNKRMALVER